MKIDPNLPFLPDSDKVDATLGQLFDQVETVAQDAVERFQKAVDSYNDLVDHLNLPLPQLPTAEDVEALKRTIQTAQLAGPSGISAGAPGQTKQALGNTEVAGDKGSVEEVIDGSIGDVDDVTKKELSDVDGILNWGKGETLWEAKDWQLWRFFELDETHQNQSGQGNISGRADFLNFHPRIFYQLDFGIAELVKMISEGKFAELQNTNILDLLVAQAGIGGQAALELIGLHGQIKYDAPQTFIAGHHTELHALLNADAFIGAIAEGGILLSIGKDTFARIGGEAFAGASASVSGKASLGDFVTVDGTGSAWAGAGAKAIAEAAFEDGKFEFRSGMGYALGLGASYDWGVSVNAGEIIGTLDDAAKKIIADPQYVNDLAMELTFDLLSNIAAPFHYTSGLMSELFPREGQQIPRPDDRPSGEAIRDRIREKQSGEIGSPS